MIARGKPVSGCRSSRSSSLAALSRAVISHPLSFYLLLAARLRAGGRHVDQREAAFLGNAAYVGLDLVDVVDLQPAVLGGQVRSQARKVARHRIAGQREDIRAADT